MSITDEVVELIKTTASSCAKQTENRLEETLSAVVDKVVKERLEPLSIEKTERLEDQLFHADSFMEELNSSLIGWLAIRITKRSIQKKSAKLKKEATDGKKDIKKK